MVVARGLLQSRASRQGHPIMEVAVLLLLTLPMRTATPVRQTHRTQIERLSPVKVIERSEVTTFLGSGTESRSLAKTDIRDDPGPGFPALLLISLHKKRVRRATPRGCQLGTCQVHNLVNKLYRMGQSNGKDPSKNANDPTGYGR